MNTAHDKAKKWLHSGMLSESEKKIIINLMQDDGQLNEAFLNDLQFGTGGIRGIMGIGTSRINSYTIGMATQGFSNYLKKLYPNTVIKTVIAYDSRNNSKKFAETTASVLSANDIEVYIFEAPRPTPELSFAVRSLNCQGGIVITASHNPKEYNGFKAYGADGAQLVSPHDKNVVEEVSKISDIQNILFRPNNKLIHPIGKVMDDSYLNGIKNLSYSPDLIPRQKDLKIVYSSLHGTGITLIPTILNKIGFKNISLVEEQMQMDGNFPTVTSPNPEEQKAMALLLQKAESIDADIALTTDPDADRVGMIVKNTHGKFQLLNGNQIGAILIYYLLIHNRNTKNGFVAKTIVTTELIKKIADDFQVSCYDTLTGFKYIAELIERLKGKEKYIGGGEESYGFSIGDSVRDKDAVATCAMLAEITAWAKEKKLTVFELLLEIYKKYGFYYESMIPLAKKGIKGIHEIESMMLAFRKSPPKKLDNSNIVQIIDYKKDIKSQLSDESNQPLYFPKSNVLQFITEDHTKVSIRPSGTEPKIKFYVSVMSSSENIDYYEHVQHLKDKIDRIISELGIMKN